MNWKWCGRKTPRSNLRCYPGICIHWWKALQPRPSLGGYCDQSWSFGLYKRRKRVMYWPDERLIASQKRLCSIQLVDVQYCIHSNEINPLKNEFLMSNIKIRGRAIAQAVSRWLPTAAARVRSQVRSCGICGGQSGSGAGFLRVLQFPLPILILPTAP
jgi:hypothetical protein